MFVVQFSGKLFGFLFGENFSSSATAFSALSFHAITNVLCMSALLTHFVRRQP